ncbi:DinB family protein [uncultured Pontibacter sp.]|uniref:DinB family protein n=1 Tax=uncultured Pontibacter sp. TaxID=453356 RepID=UPI00261ED9DF|nr:DinB family protein [uncultured Pontibacter sp.]
MNKLEQLAQTNSALTQTVTTQLAKLDLETLNFKPHPDSWSILECLEHLNRYSRYYNSALATAIAHNSNGTYLEDINYSWLGKKTLEMVGPQSMKKHKTVKHMNPNNSKLGRGTIDEFLKNQEKLQQLLQNAKGANLSKKAVPVEFFKLLKLRIGETLEFMVAHQERHVLQALRVKQQLAQQVAA